MVESSSLRPMTAEPVIFDTSVFMDHLRTNKFENRLAGFSGLIRNSSVVLSELLRGATKREEKEFVLVLARNHRILSPTEKNWMESGEILLAINQADGFNSEKLRDLHFDVLIALTARNYGATVITANKRDFELIKKHKDFKLEIW